MLKRKKLISRKIKNASAVNVSKHFSWKKKDLVLSALLECFWYNLCKGRKNSKGKNWKDKSLAEIV